MSKNMSSNNSGYNSAAKEYKKLQAQYTGNAGYENSLKQAGKGASVQAANTRAEQQTAMRNAGRSSNAAAILAANNVANNYNQAFQGQQNMAYNAGTDKLNSQGQYMGSQQTEGQNRYNRAWGNLGAGTGIFGSVMGGIASISDEKCKDAVKLTSGTDDFFKKHKKRNFSDLVIKGDE